MTTYTSRLKPRVIQQVVFELIAIEQIIAQNLADRISSGKIILLSSITNKRFFICTLLPYRPVCTKVSPPQETCDELTFLLKQI